MQGQTWCLHGQVDHIIRCAIEMCHCAKTLCGGNSRPVSRYLGVSSSLMLRLSHDLCDCCGKTKSKGSNGCCGRGATLLCKSPSFSCPSPQLLPRLGTQMLLALERSKYKVRQPSTISKPILFELLTVILS